MNSVSSEPVETDLEASEVTDGQRSPSAVFDALGDDKARSLFRLLRDYETPLTVQDLSSELDLSLTSIYRKLDQLVAAGLVKEEAAVDEDGHRRSRYRPVVDRIDVRFEGDGAFEVEIYRSTASFRSDDG